MNNQIYGYLADVQKLGLPSIYQIWKIKMKHILLLADVWDIVDPTHESYLNPKSNHKALTPVNASIQESRKELAMAILQSALNNATKNSISQIKEPRQCWLELQKHFAPNTVARKFYLYRSFVGLKMKEGEPFDRFFDKFVDLKCALEDVGKSFKEEDLVFAILRALPQSWNGFTRKCLMPEKLKQHGVLELCQRIRAEEQWMGVLAKLSTVKKLSF